MLVDCNATHFRRQADRTREGRNVPLEISGELAFALRFDTDDKFASATIDHDNKRNAK